MNLRKILNYLIRSTVWLEYLLTDKLTYQPKSSPLFKILQKKIKNLALIVATNNQKKCLAKKH
jgi:hypothetical protein